MIDRRAFPFPAMAFAVLLAAPGLANQLDPGEKIDIELKSASLTETLQSFAAITGSTLDMPDDIAGTVTIAVKARPWMRVLDDICRQHDLRCESFGADPPVLRVRPAGDGPAGFGQAISLELVDADVGVVFTSFEKISGRPFEVADVGGMVSFSFRRVPWPRALEEVCALAGCRVVWGGDTVGIERMETEEMSLLNMSLADADVGETLRAFASFPLFGSTATRVEIDPAVHGGVTVELKYVNWAQALDLVCAQAGCRWTLEYGDPSVLHVVPAGPDLPHAAALVHEPGAEIQTVAYRFEAPGAPPLAGVAAFTWAEPIHVHAVDGSRRLRLSWIPLGPERAVVLPLIERCETTWSSVVLLDPITLPIEKETRHQADGATLTFLPSAADAPTSPPAKVSVPCDPERRGEIQVTVRRRGGRRDDAPRAERRFRLASHLLVMPVETREPVAALVALGVGPDGRQELAVLRPGGDGTGVDIETLSVSLGEKIEKIVLADDRAFELAIEYEQD